MSSHGDQILFEILEELRELKAFLMQKPFPTTLQELEDEVAAARAEEEGED